jgi:hypothetical protein
MDEATNALIDTISHDLDCTLPVKYGVSLCDLAREIIRLRGKIESGGQEVWETKQVEEVEDQNG